MVVVAILLRVLGLGETSYQIFFEALLFCDRERA